MTAVAVGPIQSPPTDWARLRQVRPSKTGQSSYTLMANTVFIIYDYFLTSFDLDNLDLEIRIWLEVLE